MNLDNIENQPLVDENEIKLENENTNPAPVETDEDDLGADEESETEAGITFKDLGLSDNLLKAIKDTGYTTPTPIQQQAIPPLLAGRDLLGCAQTGTGKTAAFALPILQRLTAISSNRPLPKFPRALILTPTRELAIQIDESFKTYGKHLRLSTTVIFGGVSQFHQVKALSRGVDIAVATPGRLLDLIQQRQVNLSKLDVFVLDEADRMLDMGFINDIKKIIPMLPAKRQNLFFSATMPKDIEALAASLLTNPARVEVTPVSSTAEKVDQSVMYVDKERKKDLLRELLKNSKEMKRVIVFTRTKHGANKVAEVMMRNQISSEAIHGNKSQNARQRALENFRIGKTRVLIATDIAARGIDIDGISHVINYELPNVAESYVHRIGRTARAGATGKAISFCDSEERAYLRDIERLIGKQIPINKDQPFHSTVVENARVMSSGKAKAAIEGRSGGSGGRGGHMHNKRKRFRPGAGGKPTRGFRGMGQKRG
jgi:ATP-dependent RNA helicase RhlE